MKERMSIIITCFLFIEVVIGLLESQASRSVLSLPLEEGLLPCESQENSSFSHQIPAFCMENVGHDAQFASPMSQDLENGTYLDYKTLLDDGFETLQISIELWVPTSNTTIDATSFSASISFNNEATNSNVEIFSQELNHGSSTYALEQVGTKEVSEQSFDVFTFNGKFVLKGSELRVNVNFLNSNLINKFLIKSFRITQSNQQVHSCEVPQFELNQILQSCIRANNNRCVNQIERISDQTCVDYCDKTESLFQLSYPFPSNPSKFCIKNYQTCDAILGCELCNESGSICFRCSADYTLSSESKCSSRFQGSESQKERRNLVWESTPNCHPALCKNCYKDFCVECRSPYINVHGVCTLCGRGTVVITETPYDQYCKRWVTSNACSNVDSNSFFCSGCFLGYHQSNGCSQTDSSKYYQTLTTQKQCSQADANCLYCSASKQCLVCASTKKLMIPDYSISNPDVVCDTSCSDGFYEDSTGFCAPCGVHCKLCSNPAVSLACILCDTGYEVDNIYSSNFPSAKQRCIPSAFQCPLNCSVCASPLVCTTCIEGYSEIGGNCIQCPFGCQTCTDTSTCTLCYDGVANSAECSQPTCAQDEFVRQDLTCKTCKDHCLKCIDRRTCNICMPGYVLEKNSCIDCPTNCLICSDMNTCLACKNGMKVETDGSCASATTQCPDGQYFNGVSCDTCSTTCKTCSTSLSCTTCANGLIPENGVCTGCLSTQFLNTSHTCETCPQNCETCADLVGCTYCNVPYSLVIATRECILASTCGDGSITKPMVDSGIKVPKTCDDQNTTDLDGCSSTCQIEAGYKCTYSSSDMKSICTLDVVTTPTNSFKLETYISKDTLKPVVNILFDYAILPVTSRVLRELEATTNEQIIKSVTDALVLDIQDTTTENYTYAVTVQSDLKSCQAEVSATSNIIEKSVTVSFTSQFQTVNNLQSPSQTTKFPDTKPISVAQKAAAEAVASVGSVAGTGFVASVIPVILFSNFSLLFNALDLFQMIFYLQYVFVRFPYNVLEFLQIMTNFQMPFSMNFIAYLLEMNPVDSPDVPRTYNDAQISGAFLDNTGDSFSQIIILVISHTLLFGIARLCHKSSKKIIVKIGSILDSKLKTSWQWGWYLDMYWEMYLSLIVGGSLQFYGLYMTDVQSVLNALFFFGSIAFTIATPFIFYRIISQNQYELESEEIKNKWGMLYETLKVSNHAAILPEEAVKLPTAEFKKAKFISVRGNSDDRKSSTSIINKERNQRIIGTDRQDKDERDYSNNNLQQSNISLSAGGIPKEENGILATSTLTENPSTGQPHHHEKVSSLCKYFYLVLYSRKIFFGIFIVALWEYPLVQLILIDMLNLGIIVFVALIQPYESKSHNYKAIACEVFMLIAQFSIKFLINDPPDQDEADRMLTGWIFIACCIAILAVQLIFVFANLILDSYKELQKFVKKCKNGNKEIIQAEQINKDHVQIEEFDSPCISNQESPRKQAIQDSNRVDDFNQSNSMPFNLQQQQQPLKINNLSQIKGLTSLKEQSSSQMIELEDQANDENPIFQKNQNSVEKDSKLRIYNKKRLSTVNRLN